MVFALVGRICYRPRPVSAHSAQVASSLVLSLGLDVEHGAPHPVSAVALLNLGHGISVVVAVVPASPGLAAPRADRIPVAVASNATLPMISNHALGLLTPFLPPRLPHRRLRRARPTRFPVILKFVQTRPRFCPKLSEGGWLALPTSQSQDQRSNN